MCCFSRTVSSVSGTKLFVRGLANARQALVYAMNVALSEELAMILPLPVPAGASDDAVTFINLEGEERFFEELATAFPTFAPQAARSSFGPVARAPKLPVFDVGRYEASFVPTAGDFGRLEERFRLPDGFLQALPMYADFGFAVFRLKPRSSAARTQAVQPMALTFRRREPRALFFPTVHVHDGRVPKTATFDHALYCQADGVLEATLGWTLSTAALGAHVHGPNSQVLLDAARGGFATFLWGEMSNADVWLREPPGVTVGDLRGGGECHAFEINATAAHAFGAERASRPAWSETASRGLAQLCRGVREGLIQLEASRRKAWNLTPLDPTLPPHFMNGPQLWRGTDYMNGSSSLTPGPGRVRFTPFSEQVAPQGITLGFARLPTPDEARAINAELTALLQRALARS